MATFSRLSVLAFLPVLALLAACGTATTHQPGAPPAPSARTPGPATAGPSARPEPSRPASTPSACPRAGADLTAVHVGQHQGYDRIVFQFSGRLPAYSVARVSGVIADPRGTPVPMAGQAYLRVVFRGATVRCQQPPHATYSGPSVLTPFYSQLLVVAKAGDFEGVLSFGIGLAARGGYHAYPLTGPDRVVIDVSHVELGKFPGIWDITDWTQYWACQYAVNNGHQPWLVNPVMVVEAWARGRWSTTPPIHQVNADSFQVLEPGGRTDTVTGTRPVSVPGPWVITGIDYGG